MLGKFVIEYIDDILIYWLCKETNIDHLKQVLRRPKDNQHYHLAFIKLTPVSVTWGTDNSSALEE